MRERASARFAVGVLAGVCSVACLALCFVCLPFVMTWWANSFTVAHCLYTVGLCLAFGAAVQLFGIAFASAVAYHDAWAPGLILAFTRPWRVPVLLYARHGGRDHPRPEGLA